MYLRRLNHIPVDVLESALKDVHVEYNHLKYISTLYMYFVSSFGETPRCI